ncbi:hypothetical protein CRG98_025450 [Punica granatum]|uniref:Uncharacterized protein n=1 Tax=Punica granatum TaxID=22663 RepID=A0A2I0JD28_PUNGR|nr:hypothetical protein CRG98_025450 [Punica granatum]
MTGMRFEVEKFDETNDFKLCQIEIKALLVEHDLERALEGENKPSATLSPNEKIKMGLTNVDIKIKDEDHALLLLSILLESYEKFVITMLYGRISITLENDKAALNLKESLKKTCDIVGIGRVRIDMYDGGKDKIGSTSAIEWTPEEKYLDVLGARNGELVPRVHDGCNVRAHPEWVESCAKATSWKKVELEDSRTPEPRLVVIEDVQTGRSEGRNSDETRYLREVHGGLDSSGARKSRGGAREGCNGEIEHEKLVAAPIDASQGGDLLEVSRIKPERSKRPKELETRTENRSKKTKEQSVKVTATMSLRT